MRSTFIGFLVAFLATGTSLYLTTNDYALYLNLVGLIIVIGGTFSSAVISFGVSTLVRISFVYWSVLKKPDYTAQSVVAQMIEVAKYYHANGVVPKNPKLHPFLSDGMRLIENEFNAEQVNEIMSSSSIERKITFERDIEIFDSLAKYPPAFGMVGTLFGLIALLNNLGDSGNPDSIGPNMAVALLTTLYGLLMANYFFTPIADNLSDNLKQELNIRRIITRGSVMMAENKDHVLIEETLKAYLLPSQRGSVGQGSAARQAA